MQTMQTTLSQSGETPATAAGSPLRDKLAHLALAVPVAVMAFGHATPTYAQWSAAGDSVTSVTEGLRGDVIVPLAIMAIILIAVLAWFSRGIAIISFIALAVTFGLIQGADDIVAKFGGSS